jgi:hypothetical protein
MENEDSMFLITKYSVAGKLLVLVSARCGLVGELRVGSAEVLSAARASRLVM